VATKNIMCFGDSLTWGWVPIENAVPTERFPPDVRWTGVLADRLGPEYRIIEEGLSGRTTAVDDPTDPRLNGAKYLPSALATHLPLDLVVIMLGTNDTKTYFHRSPFEIATGMSLLLTQVATSAGGVGTAYPAPRALVVAPPKLVPMPNAWFAVLFEEGEAKSRELPRLYEALASFMGAAFFDAGTVIKELGVDGLHFSEQNNLALGEALADVIRPLLGD
jgi:lysophospholipase L1-like esterase